MRVERDKQAVSQSSRLAVKQAGWQAVSVNVMHGIKRQTQNENVCWSFIMGTTTMRWPWTRIRRRSEIAKAEGSDSNNFVRNLSDNFHTISMAKDTAQRGV